MLRQVWDMRSKNQIHVLGGHTNTVGALLTQSTDPQIITGGMDSQVKVCMGGSWVEGGGSPCR